MKRSTLFTAAAILILLAAPLRAREVPEMPENFGTDQWAVANYEQAVHYLKYLSDEKTRRKMLNAPIRERLEVWQSFWKELDPVPATAENEYQDAYFARIRYANESYSEMLRDGWLTDRGEAYIRLGAPMLIERFPMRSGGKDLEVWNYWSSHDRYLVFMDRTGVGDYLLLNPEEMIDEVFLSQVDE